MFGSQLEYLAATCIDMTRFQFESPSSAHVGCISAVIVDILLIVDETFSNGLWRDFAPFRMQLPVS